MLLDNSGHVSSYFFGNSFWYYNMFFFIVKPVAGNCPRVIVMPNTKRFGFSDCISFFCHVSYNNHIEPSFVGVAERRMLVWIAARVVLYGLCNHLAQRCCIMKKSIRRKLCKPCKVGD